MAVCFQIHVTHVLVVVVAWPISLPPRNPQQRQHHHPEHTKYKTAAFEFCIQGDGGERKNERADERRTSDGARERLFPPTTECHGNNFYSALCIKGHKVRNLFKRKQS